MRHPMASVPRRKELRHHHHHHHHRQQHDEHRSTRNINETRPARPSTHKRRPEIKKHVRDLQDDLGEGKQDFVRGWLDRVPSGRQRDGDGQTYGGQSLGRPSYHHTTTHLIDEDRATEACELAVSIPTRPPFLRKGQSRELEEIRDRLPQELTPKTRMPACARSFTLPISSPEELMTMNDEREISSNDGEIYEGGKRPRSRSHTNSSLRLRSGSGGRRYEKRPRHKTRQDRYDTFKSGQMSRSKTADGMRAPTTRAGGSKARNLKKKAMASAREVVDHFTSQSILKDRLTMNPSVKPGLYQNGRVSTSKPLTDLTFHDMRFLQQPRRSTTESATKAHLRDKRREEEELQGISAFFSNRKPADLSHQSRSKQVIVHSPIDLITTEYSASGGESVIPLQDKFSKPSLPSGRRRINNTPTQPSWSSHPSMETSANSKNRSLRHYVDESLGTKSVRKALDKTGVFRNTGIVLNPSLLDGEDIPPFSRSTAAQKSQGTSRPHDEHLKSHIIRYRDQGTMVPDHIGGPSYVQSGTGAGEDDKPASLSLIDHRAPHSPRVERNHPSNNEAVGSSALRSPHTGTQQVVKEGCALPDAHQLAEPPDRPEAPKCLLVDRLEAMATMPPPPRPLAGRLESNQRDASSPAGANCVAEEISLPCNISDADSRPTPAASQLTGQAVHQFINRQPSRASTPFIASTWLTPTGTCSGTPCPGVTNSTVVPMALDSHIQTNPYVSSLSIAFSASDTAPRCEDQSSMREYIGQIEKEVLSRPFSEELGYFEEESIFRAHSDSRDVGIPTTSHHLMSGQQYQRPSSELGLHEPEESLREAVFAMRRLHSPSTSQAQLATDWKHSTRLGEDTNEEEEARMAQFWRPNQYVL